MGSVLSSGHYANEAEKIKNTPCRQSKDGKHKWKKQGSGPSAYDKCEHCKTNVYYK